MTAFKSIQVHDLISVGPRLWEVVGVYFGALHYEAAVELVCMDGTLHAGSPLTVPLDLIPANAVYRRVDHEKAKAGATS